jgi:hypothetical protein
MGQSFSRKATTFSASNKKFPAMWNPKFHHRVEKSRSVAHMVNQMNQVHVFPSYLPKTNFNIILPSSKWSPYPRVSYQNSERNFQALQSCSNPMLSCSHISYAAERRPITLRRCLCILIVVYVILLFVHVFLLFVHVFLTLSMYTYCCLCILRRGYPD